ncbi:hypothetical protein EL17_06245 [Anditalea andensis]|uniref:DUF4199 domain-containing protein n=1 Tax=Anditalea andensis TaxID=1048983 RepID=A0A074L377_9BACT|nr:hypothetical protein EL17_06245 [Anditalea andensis]
MDKYIDAAYKFGVIGGALCGIAFWLMYLLGAEPVGMTLVFGYLITPIFVFIGAKNFRDNYNNREMTFGQSMTVGFFVYTLIAVISAIIVYISLLMTPDVLIDYRAVNLQLLDGKKSEWIDQLNVEAFETTRLSIAQMSAYNVAMNDFLRKIIPGLFYTIIISIILKQTKE